MANKEIIQPPQQKKNLGDKTLEGWENLNKITLTAETTAIAVGLLVPYLSWLATLGVAFGAGDLGSDYARSSIQQDRQTAKDRKQRQVKEYTIFTSKKSELVKAA